MERITQDCDKHKTGDSKIRKKYFVVGTPTDQYYPWLLYQNNKTEPFFFDSIEDAKKAIADERYRESKPDPDDFWIGEKIEYDMKEVNSMRKTWKEAHNG